MAFDTRAALREGLADALGFVLGGLAGWQLSRWLGVDVLATPGFSGPHLLGLLLILAGMGGCRWLMRRLLLPRKT
ncbi:hypothetical protein LZ017_10270 [Pelomonas sp. CA6]|uniref:hypothetical protein n=1 Tax=Pelomonas sp. CA6 TaxID=2907999 RepID=UPI001F4C236D|nr:hypothetical protein [Pelomonas sp. CA6]MCH7343764.1 hypothetical protein [Pelomonas sp. CA6]